MKKIAFLLLFLFIFLLFVHDIQAYDAWWHLKTGEYILQNLKILHQDLYSFVSTGRPWIDMQWFFEVALFTVYLFFNLGGLVIFKALLLLSVFLILFKAASGSKDTPVALAAGFLTALCLWERALLRPEIFSFFYLSLYIYILHRYKYAKNFNIKNIYFLPLIQVFWVNSHALFILGILMVWSYIAGEFLSARLDEKYRVKGKAYKHLLLSGILVVLVSFFNPYALEGFLFPLKLFTRINGTMKIFSTIGEFQPPFSYFCQNSTITYYKILLFTSLAVIGLNFRRLSMSHLISYACFLYLSLAARRNIPLFALVCFPVIVENSRQIIGRYRGKIFDNKKARDCVFFVIAVVLVFSIADVIDGGKYIRGDSERRLSVSAAPFKYPVGAARFINAAGISGNMFNDLQGGNYLIWHLYPQRRVFLDGRFEVHDEKFYAEYVRLLEQPRLWPAIAEKYKINYAVFSHNDADMDKLLLYLYDNPGWKLVFFDDVSVVFVKDVPENRAIVDRYAVDVFSAGFGDLSVRSDIPGETISRIYFQRGSLFAKFRNFDKAKENYAKALIYNCRNDKVHINLGIMYWRQKNINMAVEEYNAALSANPHSSLAYFNLGNLYYGENNIPLALTYYFKAIETDPLFDAASFNVAGICMQYGQYSQAARRYLEILKNHPWNTEARNNLGVAYAQQGLPGEAREQFVKVLKEDPGNYSALKNIERLNYITRK